MTYKLTYKPFGERSILIEWPHEINENILENVLSFKEKLQAVLIEQVIEVKHAYNSILLTYKNYIFNFNECITELKSIYNSTVANQKLERFLWTIPVCYDAVFGLDLEALSQEKNIPIADVIKLHTEAIYTVYFIGFLPGFLYLGGLNEILNTPRKASPRLKIQQGAVAIGGNQTGVYPTESPGGWNIIGNTPISFFNPILEKPCFAKAGDKIKFKSVSIDAYNDIKLLVEAGVYHTEREVIDA